MNTASTLISDQPMRVLTRDLGDRLQAVTDALRHMLPELPLAKQELRQGTSLRPLLHFHKPIESLRECMTSIAVKDIGGRRCVVGKFRRVDLCWPAEPAQH